MIQLELKNGNIDIRITGNPTVEEITHMLQQTQLHVMRTIVKEAPTAQQEKLKALLYDLVNLKMSAVLESFAPDYELRPGLTAEAILKAENELLKEKTDALSKMQNKTA